jgi:hypothetical protein
MNKFLLSFLVCFLLASYVSMAQYTVSGFVRNDPNAGTVNGGTSLGVKDNLVVVLVKSPENTVAAGVNVNKSTGAFSMSNVPTGTYYAMLITPDAPSVYGTPAPPSILETSWTFTGESVVPMGPVDVTPNGITEVFAISANFSGLQFGIQERPFAANKMNAFLDNTSTMPVALTVNTGSAFNQGGPAILSGTDNGGGTITDYSITALPKHGMLYVSGIAVSSLTDVASLTPAQFATLSYQPGSTATTQELDFFTYKVTDNALTKSNNATYVIPFQLLDGDTDAVANRFDHDDDNDGITDVTECYLNDPTNFYLNLRTALGTNQFTFLRPSHFGLSIAQRTGETLTQDVSALFSKPAGSIVVTITNANTHPTANEFYVNDITGPSQWTISGTLGAYTAITHGAQYFSYDTRTITLLNGTPMSFAGAQGQSNPAQTGWSSGSNGYSWWLTNNNTLTNPVSEGNLLVGLIDPEPKYFEVASTANNRDEWATYFVQILPECDYDNDGIPNRLDLDSDNDGCLDALEGGATFQLGDVLDAGGTVSVGPGSVAPKKNLCASSTCVDINGIPTVAGSTGQAAGTAYNASEISDVCETAMPVTLMFFKAAKTENKTKLEWATTTEQNNVGFSIERSNDAKNWKEIGFVNSLSKSNSDKIRIDYKFTDESPAKGYNLYRLKQLDSDGKFEYSRILSVQFEDEINVVVYPNPTITDITVSGLNGGEIITLYDLNGKSVGESEISKGQKGFLNTKSLADGMYLLLVRDKSGKLLSSKKILKVGK